MVSASKVLGATFRCIRFIRFEPGSESNESSESTMPPQDIRYRLPPNKISPGASESSAANESSESNESNVVPKAQDFRFSRCMRVSAWPEANASNASKVGPKARTSDAFDPLAASEPEARASGVVSESKVLGATLDSLDSFD